MTMILTCLTKDFIVQASDRRLSIVDGNNVRPREDHSNKALIYSNCFVFAYTGLAKLDSQSASAIDWAAQQLSEKENIGESVLHLGNRASDLMNSSYSHLSADKKRLTFVGAGFANVDRKPLRIVISNFRGENDTVLAQARKEFTVYFDWLPERHNFELLVAGRQFSKDKKIEINNLIRSCLRQKKGPETIGRLLTLKIQEKADEDKAVGKNIMCTFVPRAYSDRVEYHFGAVLLENPINSTEPQRLEPVKLVSVHDRFALPPPFDAPRFVYIAGDNKAQPYHGPILVLPGLPGSVMQMSVAEMSIVIPPVQTQPVDVSEI